MSSLRCAKSCGLQIVGYNPHSGRHHMCYADGFDEWLTVAEEAVQWLQRTDSACLSLPAGKLAAAPAHSARGSAPNSSSSSGDAKLMLTTVGGDAGQQQPVGAGAVGWQVAVYDAEDQMFFTCHVAGYLPEVGHQLRTSGQDVSYLDLAACKVKWLVAPHTPAASKGLPEPQMYAA